MTTLKNYKKTLELRKRCLKEKYQVMNKDQQKKFQKFQLEKSNFRKTQKLLEMTEKRKNDRKAKDNSKEGRKSLF